MINIILNNREKEKIRELEEISDTMKTIQIGKNEYEVKVVKNKTTITFTIVTDIMTNGITEIVYKNLSEFKLRNLVCVIEDLYLPNDKNLQEKLHIIYCVDDVCPICGMKLKQIYSDKKECKNKCYEVLIVRNGCKINFLVKIFKTQEYEVYPTRALKEKIEIVNQICYQINFWKNNDRYLMRLIEGEN
ncbi:gp466 [Bacillus phage G]|uniref:Gp466 n=1 Tax=Bacillus phage G TaxID=2884420 RepID=G3MAK7_9CAUD|nr:gp466 [Bacillus phage G]AEO93724.1 gp466 [Bacillus phage G]